MTYRIKLNDLVKGAEDFAKKKGKVVRIIVSDECFDSFEEHILELPLRRKGIIYYFASYKKSERDEHIIVRGNGMWKESDYEIDLTQIDIVH